MCGGCGCGGCGGCNGARYYGVNGLPCGFAGAGCNYAGRVFLPPWTSPCCVVGNCSCGNCMVGIAVSPCNICRRSPCACNAGCRVCGRNPCACNRSRSHCKCGGRGCKRCRH